MAKIYRIKKSNKGKAVFCSKCRKGIAPGTEYLKATPYHRKPIIRCLICGLRSWETSSSEYVLEIGSLVEDWEQNIGVSETTIDDIKDVLETQKDQAEDSLSNMPDQLQESSEAGMMLQERIEQLESAISDLEDIDYDTCITDAEEDAAEEIGEWPDDEEMDAWKTKEGFISIQLSDDCWDYSLYSPGCELLDGGQFDCSDISIEEARDQILKDAGWDTSSLIAVGYEALEEAVEGITSPDELDGSGDVRNTYATRTEWELALNEAKIRLGEEAFAEAVNDALSGLEY